MQFEIKHTLNGKILFKIETESWKLAIEAAIKQDTNLSFADLSSANLRFADLSSANLRFADLRFTDLRSADLRSANLRSADLDFSCWPLWCGSVGVKVDVKQARQLLYHALAVNCDDKEFKAIKKNLKIKKFANKFHRVESEAVPKL